MPVSTATANKEIDHLVGKTSFTMPTGFYVGFSSTLPTIAGTNITEPSGGSYARKSTAGSDWTAASSGATSNANTLTWTTASADWASGANLGWFVFYDAATTGNFLGFCAVTTPRPVLSGNTASVAAGGITVTIS